MHLNFSYGKQFHCTGPIIFVLILISSLLHLPAFKLGVQNWSNMCTVCAQLIKEEWATHNRGMFSLLIQLALLLPVLQASLVHLETKQGRVKGKIYSSGEQSFTNLPYAVPPVGHLRFQPALPAPPQPNVTHDASLPTIMCPQLDGESAKGVEDCLVLHVFTPETSSLDEPLPVMVFVHGGSFTSGSGEGNGPWLLVERNVVVVLINYRLGVLGGLTTGTDEAPGNLGIRDIILALNWVRDNIEDYGGNPERVTLFGESAGSMAISAVLASPALEEGLLSGAILQSGTMVRAMEMAGERDSYPEYARKVGEGLGCNPDSLLECLKATSVEDLVRWTNTFKPARAWEPWVDASLGPTSVLPLSTLEAFRAGRNRKMDLIMGSNSGDGWLYAGSLFTDPANWVDWAENWHERITSTMIGRSEPSLQVGLNCTAAGYLCYRTQP